MCAVYAPPASLNTTCLLANFVSGECQAAEWREARVEPSPALQSGRLIHRRAPTLVPVVALLHDEAVVLCG
eukprot:847893-Pleurochrysis_carterae.AAC.1